MFHNDSDRLLVVSLTHPRPSVRSKRSPVPLERCLLYSRARCRARAGGGEDATDATECEKPAAPDRKEKKNSGLATCVTSTRLLLQRELRYLQSRGECAVSTLDSRATVDSFTSGPSRVLLSFVTSWKFWCRQHTTPPTSSKSNE